MRNLTRISRVIGLAISAAMAFAANTFVQASPSDVSEVRNTVQHVFDQLKAGNFGALYDVLPSSSQSRISREQFVSALDSSRNLFQLERIEVGAVRVSGDLAVVDTVMYAHVAPPFDADGKMVVQQYLIRENGSWRVATGDRETIDRFLSANPTFARKFPIKRPVIYVKRDGNWVVFDPKNIGRRK